jgi:site-specific recombinase XerD
LGIRAIRVRDGADDWRRLKHRHLHDFISQYGANGRTAAAQVAAVSLRSFLRWLQFQGRVDDDVVTAVPSFRRWRLASLPMVMSSDQLQAFLAFFNRRDPSGRRDYAMALCMVELGLRVAEVANLQVGDVDFAAETLHLSTRKSRHASMLPMPHRVYQAITAYIRKDRPKTDNSFLFVRHRIPRGAPVTRELIRGVVRRAYAAIPGCEEWTGTHPLRHTAATRWQRAGADLKQIADLLGHCSLDTTAIYAKVDFARLAQVALPWPGQEARS